MLRIIIIKISMFAVIYLSVQESLLAKTYSFHYSHRDTLVPNKGDDISSVIFSNGTKIQRSGQMTEIRIFEKNSKDGYVKLGDSFVQIHAAFPSRSNAKVAIIRSNCMCTAQGDLKRYHLAIISAGKLMWYDFFPYPFNNDFSLNFRIEGKNDPKVDVQNMTGLAGFNELDDAILFKYKFLENFGFVNESFNPNPIYSGLIGYHPESVFGDENLRKPLIKILKKGQFSALRRNMQVAEESFLLEDKYIVFNGCRRHNCPGNEGSLIIDVTGDGIWAIWSDEDEKKIYFASNVQWTREILGKFKLSKFDIRGEEEKSNVNTYPGIFEILEIAARENVKVGEVNINKVMAFQAREKISLTISNTEPEKDGSFTISIQTNTDTASLQINGEELGGRADGSYTIKRIARAGQDTKLDIVATDTNGNTDTKTITVSRPVAESKPVVAVLNPAQVKKQPERDAVAIIIGIADYKNLPRADFANDDARVFYDYAVRALGVKPENIKLLVDTDADDVAIYQAFKTWLPGRVRAGTDVYVYYSGHGLPTADGQGLYLLPQRAHRDFIDKTAITQAEINAAIQAAKPRSVTVFLDACYSGQARSGETLIASARPVALKTAKQLFPDNFTVITASQADQISSSSPDLKHGIFSYYLMRGMEGDADANRDGKITAGEMQTYLLEQVTRQAGMMNRKQEPQLTGDANRVLVGR
jgi:hypothetical protein